MCKKSHEGKQKVALTERFWGVNLAMVESKKTYLEDVCKMAHNLLKMHKRRCQTESKNGSRLSTLCKVTSKIVFFSEAHKVL